MLSWRRLGVLLRHLPYESATMTALRDGEPHWTPDTWMLANVLDTLRGGNWQRSGGKGARPRPVKRPGDRVTIGRTRKGFATPAELMEEMARIETVGYEVEDEEVIV